MPRKLNLSHVPRTAKVPSLFPPGDHRKVVDIAELSELSGIGIPTLRDWLRRGTIPGAFQRQKNAKWRFRRELLEPWWEELLTRHLDRR